MIQNIDRKNTIIFTVHRIEEKEEDVDDPEEENEPLVAAPQLKIGPDGKFILDDTSLVIFL